LGFCANDGFGDIPLKIALSAAALAAILAVGGVAVTATTASARVVCNAQGDCWHTDNRRDNYGPRVVLQSHPDAWYFHQKWQEDKNRHWRDHHDGRGYYDNGTWMPHR
jgi:hypothetical protein